jgi:hypothetical protein
VGSNMHGSSYSSVGTAFGMPSASSSRTANRRVVTMAAKGELHPYHSVPNVQLDPWLLCKHCNTLMVSLLLALLLWIATCCCD